MKFNLLVGDGLLITVYTPFPLNALDCHTRMTGRIKSLSDCKCKVSLYHL